MIQLTRGWESEFPTPGAGKVSEGVYRGLVVGVALQPPGLRTFFFTAPGSRVQILSPRG